MRIHSTLQQETFKTFQSMGWSGHPLGKMETWSPVLIQILNVIFNSHQPSFVFWGKDAACFYNDGYIPILGKKKHPQSMGARADEVWGEIWNIDTNPQYSAAMRGEATWNVDRMVPIERNGVIEEAYFTYGYSPLYEESGEVLGVYVTALETTTTVNSNRIAEEIVEQLSLALEVLSIGFYDWDIVNDRIVFNAQMQKDWGFKAGTPLSVVLERIHPEDQARVNAAIESAIKNKTRYQCLYRIIDGERIEWIDARGSISFDGDRPIRFFGTSQVVTELERTRNAFSQEKAKLEAIFASAPAALAFWRGEDFVFENVNPLYASIFPGKDLLGKPLLEAIPELKGQGFDDLLRKVLRTGEPFIGSGVSAMIPDAQGNMHEHFYDFAYIQIKDEDGKPFGVFDHAIDVTERVLANRGQEEEKLLRETVIQALTHDLRSPLTAARLSAQLAQRDMTPEKRGTFLQRIVDTMDRAERMIQDLLDTNRLKAGEALKINLKKGNLAELVKSTVLESSAINGDCFQYEGPEEVIADFDGEALRRILDNLFSNALKYGDLNFPILTKVTPDSGKVRVSVTNQGNPIPDLDQKKIFGAYYRTKSASDSQQKGWGIGLTLVEALSRAHGGEAKVESSQENGTTFEIVLPM